MVDTLLAKYPEITETEETVWADAPMKNNIIGQFINMAIMWTDYVEAAEFVIQTAHSLGLLTIRRMARFILHQVQTDLGSENSPVG